MREKLAAGPERRNEGLATSADLSTIRLIQAAIKDRDIANRGAGKDPVRTKRSCRSSPRW
jgi:hypothetical protein